MEIDVKAGAIHTMIVFRYALVCVQVYGNHTRGETLVGLAESVCPRFVGGVWIWIRRGYRRSIGKEQECWDSKEKFWGEEMDLGEKHGVRALASYFNERNVFDLLKE
jgi:hypothetical protein